jgi:hypothetical protein
MRLAVTLMLAAALATPGLAAAKKKPATPKPPPAPTTRELAQQIEEQKKQLAELVALLEAQRALLEEQAATIVNQQAALEQQTRRAQELEAALLQVQNSVNSLQNVAPQPTLDEALEARLKAIETRVEKSPDVSEVVSAGEFPGSIRVPGTDAAVKIGGQVRVSLVQNLDAIGTDDRFVTSSIPASGTEASGKGPRLTLSARASRFNFDFRTPTQYGAMRAFIEADFAGEGNNLLRMRHAFGRWQRWLAGQTWSTFSDPEAEPDGLDFEGLNAIALLRQVQVRYTFPLSENTTLAGSLENPRCSVSGEAQCVSQFPDFVIRWRQDQPKWMPRAGHLQAGAIVRNLTAEPLSAANAVRKQFAWGLAFSGDLAIPKLGEKDRIKFAVYGGKGYGSYVADLNAAGGQDAVYDPANDRLVPLQASALYGGFEHWWNDRFRSTFTAGWVWVDNIDLQPGSAYYRTSRYSLNLAWSPVERLDLIVEALTGTRVNKDRTSGWATQLQAGGRFLF